MKKILIVCVVTLLALWGSNIAMAGSEADSRVKVPHLRKKAPPATKMPASKGLSWVFTAQAGKHRYTLKKKGRKKRKPKQFYYCNRGKAGGRRP